MHRLITLPTRLLFCIPFLLLMMACDPLAPVRTPTPQTIVVTGEPTATAWPTATRAVTRTPIPTPTDAGTPTPTPFPCDEEAGQVLPFDQFRSEIADENLRYRVYIPPCYLQTQKRYPYVLLFHGQGSTENQWVELGASDALDQGIRLSALPPMILVMPFFGSIGNEDAFPPDPSYEAVVLEELVPAVERDFCTWNDREHRAIGGISRGGFWAYSIALRHPDSFG